MKIGSLFAGIGGFDLGFERAGCRVLWQVEQDGKAQSVLSKRFPDAELHSDVRTANGLQRVDVITGGFPCQDVSVAGTRKGLVGERTGLFWQIVRIARELEPRWMVLENVPGLLSSHRGRDFYAVLHALAECGFRRAYRILDSRYFGVAQRRRRVFLVLRARECGDGPASVLFESARGEGDSASRSEARACVAATLRGRSSGTGVNAPGRGGEDCRYGFGSEVSALSTEQTPAVYGVHANQRGELRTSALAGSLNGSRSGKQYEGVFATLQAKTGGNHIEDNYINALCPVGGGPDDNDAQVGHLIVPERERALVGSMHKRHDDDTDTLIPTLDTSLGHHRGSLGVGDFCLPTLQASLGHHGHSSPRGDGHDPIVPIAWHENQGGQFKAGSDLARALKAEASHSYQGVGVRRLTPLECERLQGFPDGWTCLCGKGHLGSSFCECADSPRYRQLGNAVTVPVAEWIARRIIEAEAGGRVITP